jgi:hypothetical protein
LWGTDPARKKQPGPWRKKPPDKEDFLKILGPIARPNYVPPKGGTRVYEKRRHAFVEALSLNSVYTPNLAYVDSQGRAVRAIGQKCDRKQYHKKPSVREGDTGLGLYPVYPAGSLMREFPGFRKRRKQICHLSHVAVQCGLEPAHYRDLIALRRLFWRVDVHGHFDRLVRRANKQIRTACERRTSTKPVVVCFVTTKPRYITRENCPVWGPVCVSCCHETCTTIRLRRRRCPKGQGAA